MRSLIHPIEWWHRRRMAKWELLAYYITDCILTELDARDRPPSAKELEGWLSRTLYFDGTNPQLRNEL